MNEQASQERLRVNRAEWIAIGALAVSICGGVFSLGVVYADVQDHERRIVSVEAIDRARDDQMTQILVRLERIDSNTQTLKERMDKGN